jgi:hypothetical protein
MWFEECGIVRALVKLFANASIIESLHPIKEVMGGNHHVGTGRVFLISID